MKIRNSALVLMLSVCTLLSAQTTTKDAKSSVKTPQNQNREIGNSPSIQTLQQGVQTPAPDFKANLQTTDTIGRTVTPPPSQLSRRSMDALDPTTNLSSEFIPDKQTQVNAYRNYTGYIGMGGSTVLGVHYNRQITPFLTLSGGIYTSRYNIDNYQSLTAGLKGGFKLQINDRISLNFAGQYNSNQNRPIRPEMMTLYPQSYYGGYVEIKLSDNWGVITGMQRQFDVFRHKWVNAPYIMPVHYNSKR